MPLEQGSRLGPYEILGPLGAGGMGEVFRARDTRLGRDVAVKVITAQVANAEDLRARFEREAKAISSLNHPNICTLFDVGHQDGVDYLVMELLEGETLASRLTRGPIPVQELVRIGIQIADALDKAHRQRLIHRDLKPGNIMLTKSGAKLLDFGLARPTGMGGAATGLTNTPTMTRPLTAEGSIVGTFHYMAPEQLEGAEPDARSDVWSLGVTLYEMATGKHAFEGRTQASLISSIMKDELRPISELLATAPPALDRVIRMCLAKDPDERSQTAHDVKLHLQWVMEGGSQTGVHAPVAKSRRVRERALAVLAGAALATAALVVGWTVTHTPEPADPVRFQFNMPSSIQVMGAPAVSPDGRIIAFDATDSTGVTRIWQRPLGSLMSTPMPGTEGATRPFWSPDSRYIGFVAGGRLKKVQVSGGPPVVICDAPTGSDGTWSEQDVIVFDGRGTDPLLKVPAGGGIAVPIVQRDSAAGEIAVGWPCFLPGGTHFIYLSNGAKAMLRICEVKTGKVRDLLPGDSRPVFAQPGFLVFSRNGTLVAQPFDPRSLKLGNDPIPIADQVLTNAVGGADFSLSENGVLVFAARGGGLGQLTRLDRNGRVTGTLSKPLDILAPSLSPDHKRVAVRIRDAASGTRDIWVVDLAREVPSRLTFDPRNENYPVWSPDGSQIAYYSGSTSQPGIYVQPSSGAGRNELIVPNSDEVVVNDWSADGRLLLYEVTVEKTRGDLWMVPVTADRKPVPVLNGPYDEVGARLSPDGRWLAYASDESGRFEVYVQSFPDAKGKWQVSTNGGTEPYWRGDGTELYYLSADQQLMSMPLDPRAASFEVVVPQALFQARVLAPVGPRVHYAVTRDGQTFYTVAPLQGGSVGTTNVVVNWAPERAKK